MTKMKDSHHLAAKAKQIIVSSSSLLNTAADEFPELLICSLHLIQQFVVLLSSAFFSVKG